VSRGDDLANRITFLSGFPRRPCPSRSRRRTWMPVTLIQNSFHASINSTSPAQHRLVVCGVVETPTPGYELRLVVAEPQGINRHILLLRLEAKPPSGRVPQHVDHRRVSFEQELGSEVFTQVTIENPGQEALTINVPQPTSAQVDAEAETFTAAFFTSGK